MTVLGSAFNAIYLLPKFSQLFGLPLETIIAMGTAVNGNINSANMFATNHEATATAAKWELTDPDYAIMEIDMKDSRLLEGVRNGLLGVKAGEECEILFCGKYGFGNSTFGMIPANSALAFKIWVVNVSND